MKGYRPVQGGIQGVQVCTERVQACIGRGIGLYHCTRMGTGLLRDKASTVVQACSGRGTGGTALYRGRGGYRPAQGYRLVQGCRPVQV